MGATLNWVSTVPSGPSPSAASRRPRKKAPTPASKNVKIVASGPVAWPVVGGSGVPSPSKISTALKASAVFAACGDPAPNSSTADCTHASRASMNCELATRWVVRAR